MRVLTRGDLDGLTSCVLLTHVENIREIRFAHPKDVQDGKVEVTKDDIIVNLPFVKGCGMWFDHHLSEEKKLEDIGKFKGRFAVAPSAARVVHDHFMHPDFARYQVMLEETDRVDSAQLTAEDVRHPKDWVLLGFTLDPRSGFGPEFQKYFRWLVEYVKELPLEKVLQHLLVKRRIEAFQKDQDAHVKLLKKYAKLDGNVIVTDLRGVKQPPVGNRFLVYTLFSKGNVEIRIHDGKDKKTVNVAIGHSIFNRTCRTIVGQLCAEYGGGGHMGAGTAQLKPEEGEKAINDIVARLKKNG